MQKHYAARPYKRAPVLPVPLHGRLRVISIDKQQINRSTPVDGGFVTEFLNPYDLPAVTSSNRSARYTFREI
jgi:hypothetical protein